LEIFIDISKRLINLGLHVLTKMNMYKLNLTRLQYEIFRLLCFKSGDKLNQREISLLLEVSPVAISKSLDDLEKGEFINVQKNKKMNLKLISLNRENSKILGFKRSENLKNIYESGLNKFLEENFPGASIILFGSYSKGEDISSSDIDIAIEDKEKNIDYEIYEKKLERNISLHFFNSFKKINKELRENIFNGIVLEGGIEG